MASNLTVANPASLIKKTALVLTIIMSLYTGLLWYQYIDDKEYQAYERKCFESSGSREERFNCLEFPFKQHQAKQAKARLYTYITIAIPIFILGSYFLYKFFFLTKRPDKL